MLSTLPSIPNCLRPLAMPPRISDCGAQITEKLRKKGDGGVWEPLFQRRGRGQRHPHVGASSGGRRALALMRKHGQKGLKSGLKNLSELRQKQNCLNFCIGHELKLRRNFFRNFSVIRVTEPGKIGFYRLLSNLLFLSVIKAKKWWILPGSNQRPKVYETSALTTELRIHVKQRIKTVSSQA